MKAKLLHAGGDTDAALELLSTLPTWHAPFIKEELFGKDTPEYRAWNRRNCYGLTDVWAIKLARMIRFDPELTIQEKIARLEPVVQVFADMSNAPDLAFLCIAEHAVSSILAGMLTADNADMEDVIRIREKQFLAAEKIMRLAESDEILKQQVIYTYKTENMLAWHLHRLLRSPHPQFAKLRENPAYREMLKKWADTAGLSLQ